MLLTWLYVPGDRPDRFGKAVASGADAVILDLEDAVALPRRDYARSAVAEFLTSSHSVPTFVRVHDVRADIPALAEAPGLAGLRLPKVETASQVLEAASLTGKPLHCLIESALGLESAYQVATAHPAVAGIGPGEEDLRSDLGVIGDEGLLWARGRIVAAARAAGLPPPIMSVYPELSDLDGLAASCALGRRLGFLGRAALHPKQLPAIVEGFRPSDEEIERARTLLAAVSDSSGALTLPDGRFADRAALAAAHRMVTLATYYDRHADR